MGWRGDRYKLNDHGHEQAANQRACSRNGEIIRFFLSVVVAEIPERCSPEISPLLPPLTRLLARHKKEIAFRQALVC